MTIQTVYTHNQIIPNLQTHMLRVTAVAQQICESLRVPVDTENILQACLLHDMGNILKFQLGNFPQFLEPEGLEFWQSVQQEYRQKYGSDEHTASIKIAEEVGVSRRVLALIDCVGFRQMQAIINDNDFGPKICEYADCRVAPFGVVSLQARLQDFADRYSKRYSSPEDEQKRKEFAQLADTLEKQIFAASSIQPDDITDDTVNARLENLKKFEIIRAID